MGDGWQATTVLNRARRAVERLAHIAEDVVNPIALISDVRDAIHTLSDPPAGDPDAVLAAASRYAEAARTAHDAKDRLAASLGSTPGVGCSTGWERSMDAR